MKVSRIEIGIRIRVYDTFFSKREPNDVNYEWFTEGVIVSIEPSLSTGYCHNYIYIIDRIVMDNKYYPNSWMIGRTGQFSISKKDPEIQMRILLIKSNQLELQTLNKHF